MENIPPTPLDIFAMDLVNEVFASDTFKELRSNVLSQVQGGESLLEDFHTYLYAVAEEVGARHQLGSVLDPFVLLRQANTARNAEFMAANPGCQDFTLAFRAMEFAGEVGEAVEVLRDLAFNLTDAGASLAVRGGKATNILKKLVREQLGFPGSRSTTRDLEDELADVGICLDLAMMTAGLEPHLWLAIARKFNATSVKLGFKTRLPEVLSDHAPDTTESDARWQADLDSLRRSYDALATANNNCHTDFAIIRALVTTHAKTYHKHGGTPSRAACAEVLKVLDGHPAAAQLHRPDLSAIATEVDTALSAYTDRAYGPAFEALRRIKALLQPPVKQTPLSGRQLREQAIEKAFLGNYELRTPPGDTQVQPVPVLPGSAFLQGLRDAGYDIVPLPSSDPAQN